MRKTIIIILSTLFLSGCAKVTRLDTGVVIDLSGRWNDTDSRLVAETLIKQCISSDWHKRYKKRKSKKPVVIVGTVRNRTMEHINVQTFIKDLERAMINSGYID